MFRLRYLLHLKSIFALTLQIMQKCFAVFDTWDEEFDKFANMLREMSKKKREEHMKFTWKANTAHKKLQERASRMRE